VGDEIQIFITSIMVTLLHRCNCTSNQGHILHLNTIISDPFFRFVRIYICTSSGFISVVCWTCISAITSCGAPKLISLIINLDTKWRALQALFALFPRKDILLSIWVSYCSAQPAWLRYGNERKKSVPHVLASCFTDWANTAKKQLFDNNCICY